MSEADSATDEFDHDLALTQLSAQHDALYEVNQALERIHRGTYGICESTGKMIPGSRLKAVPWARFTLKVEKKLEKDKCLHSIHMNAAGTVRSKGRMSFATEENVSSEESGTAGHDLSAGGLATDQDSPSKNKRSVAHELATRKGEAK